MFENIDLLLAIDPTYLALFGGMALASVQVLKETFKYYGGDIDGLAILLNVLISMAFAGLLVDFSVGWQQGVISMFVLTYMIASSASGTYSWVKKKEVNVDFANYLDEK